MKPEAVAVIELQISVSQSLVNSAFKIPKQLVKSILGQSEIGFILPNVPELLRSMCLKWLSSIVTPQFKFTCLSVHIVLYVGG